MKKHFNLKTFNLKTFNLILLSALTCLCISSCALLPGSDDENQIISLSPDEMQSPLANPTSPNDQAAERFCSLTYEVMAIFDRDQSESRNTFAEKVSQNPAPKENQCPDLPARRREFRVFIEMQEIPGGNEIAEVHLTFGANHQFIGFAFPQFRNDTDGGRDVFVLMDPKPAPGPTRDICQVSGEGEFLLDDFTLSGMVHLKVIADEGYRAADCILFPGRRG